MYKEKRFILLTVLEAQYSKLNNPISMASYDSPLLGPQEGITVGVLKESRDQTRSRE